MNRLQKLQYSHPRTWAVLAFIPFVVFTVVGFPLSLVHDFCHSWWREFKCLLEDIHQFHGRLWYDVKGVWRENFNIIKCIWKILFNSARGGQPFCQQREGNDDETGNETEDTLKHHYVFTDEELTGISNIDVLERRFADYYNLCSPEEDDFWCEGYEDEILGLEEHWRELHNAVKTDADLIPDNSAFWKKLKHVVDVARKGARQCKPNSREYWTFCAIVGELVTLIGDERFNGTTPSKV